MRAAIGIVITSAIVLLAAPTEGGDGTPFELKSLVYDGKTVFMRALVDIHPADRGKPKDAPVFVGLTLFKADGTAIDLPARKLTGKARRGPVRIQAKIGRGIVGYIATAWWKQVKPCKVDRPGCKQHGYVLDDPIMAHPWNAYDGWADEVIFERFPGGTGKVVVRVLDAGAKQIVLDAAAAAAEQVLSEQLELYGRPHEVVRGEAKNPRQVVEILYKHEHDQQLAAQIMTAMKKQLKKPQTVHVVPGQETVIQVPPRPKYKLTHWPQAPANFVIAAGRKAKKK